MGKLADIIGGVADAFHAIGGRNSNKFTSVILVAGGSSSRFGGETTKQMTSICGKTVVEHTIQAFQDCERISEIIVAAKEDELCFYEGLIKSGSYPKLAKAVKGGSTRQESVLYGFEEVSEKAEFVAIHDGARCLITTEDIEKVLDAAIKYGAATASVSVSDTVKIVDKNGFITNTEERSFVKLAQTPQIFKKNLYCAAAYTAKEENFEATDDNMLVERISYPVKAVECSKDNFKVTFPEDIKKAEEILLKRSTGDAMQY